MHDSLMAQVLVLLLAAAPLSRRLLRVRLMLRVRLARLLRSRVRMPRLSTRRLQ